MSKKKSSAEAKAQSASSSAQLSGRSGSSAQADPKAQSVKRSLSRSKDPDFDWKWNFRFVSLVTALTLLRVLFAMTAELKYEEAYYWLYSQHLSLSYFDHPPLVGWLIYISTSLTNDAEFWLRLPTVLCGAFTLLLIYLLAERIFNPKIAFIAACIAAALPAFELYAIFTMPDAPLLTFWCLGLYAGYRLYDEENKNFWLLLGAATGLAMLSKYPGLLTPLAALLTIFFKKKFQLFKCWQFPVSIILALAIFSPVIIWNYQNNWVSFLYQGACRFGEATSLLDKFGGSALNISALATPLGIIFFAFCIWKCFRHITEEKWFYLFSAFLPFAAIILAVMSVRLVQLNWPLPVYPALVIMTAAILEEEKVWNKWSWRTVLGVIFIPAILISLTPLIVAIKPFTALNRVNEIKGWDTVGKEAAIAINKTDDPSRCFIAGNAYGEAAEIAYYSKMPERTLSSNVFGDYARSFDFWSPKGAYQGWDCIYIVTERVKSDGSFVPLEPFQLDFIEPCFESIDTNIKKITAYNGGKPLRRYRIYTCHGYKGIPCSPEESFEQFIQKTNKRGILTK
ncbi:glycosyltransferase family 39 protein [bacterium]|nr:glycosyltransferase family 39 protein [bacterium]